MNRRHAFVFWFCAMVTVILPAADKAQTRKAVRQPQVSERPVCSDEDDQTRDTRTARLSFVSYLRAESECGVPRRERWGVHDELPQPRAESSATDPIEDELSALRTAGYAIAGARQHVLAILRENSSCSAWYAQAEPDPAEKFASLHFRADSNGEDAATGEYGLFGWVFREPYVARAQQAVGAGSIITLNSNGAFFVSHAPARTLLPGGPLIPQPHRQLHVSAYSGGSLNAQVATLLHEYGHIVGLLPVDKGEAGSALVSTQNTEIVLDHCRKQIEASANRAIMLPLSLALLQQKPKKH